MNRKKWPGLYCASTLLRPKIKILNAHSLRFQLSHEYDCAYFHSLQGILRLRGRPTVAYDQQGLVFAVAMEGGAIKLFDSRSYDKVHTGETLPRLLTSFLASVDHHSFMYRDPSTPS